MVLAVIEPALSGYLQSLFIEAQFLPKSVPGDGDDESGICSDGFDR